MSAPELPAEAALEGLPDTAMLARLANEFFATLPGTTRPPTPPGPAAASPDALVLGAAPVQTSALHTPGSAATAVAQPGLALPAAPASPGALSVPQHFESAPPDLAASPTSPAPPSPTQAIYFIEDAGVPLRREAARTGFAMPIGTSVFAQSFAMPGTEALLARLPASAGQASVGLPGVGADAQQRFGFLADVPAAQSMPGAATPLFLPSTFDVHAVRRDFPILSERVNGRPLVWFDNAATTQKPQAVIDRLTYFYEHENSNIHRAAHELAARATDAYEGARETVRRFLGARFTDEIVFVRGSTEAINLVAKSWGAQNIGAGDEIILSHLEHHANIVPWQQLAAEKGAKLRVIPVDDSGQVLLDAYQQLLNPRTKMVAVTQVSNALGTVVPVHEIVARAHQAGACVLIDGAQSVSHMRVDMQSLDADFFVFSGHKIFGPTGIGVLYGKRAVLEKMPPWQGGGNMIVDVTFEKTVFQGPPGRFEAGTGNIADAVGLGAALEYVERIGIEAIGAYEHALLEYATRNMEPIPGVRLIGTAQEKASVLSFVMEGKETEEVGQALNAEGIAVRTGHHCAQPILRRFGLETTVRPSLAFYNTCEEVDRMVAVVRQLAGTGR